MDGIYRRSCRGALRGAWVRCVRTAALFWVLFWCQKSTATHVFRNRAVRRVVIFRRCNLRGQAAIRRCVHDFLRSKGDAALLGKPPKKAHHQPSPAHGGRRATGSAREAVKANATLFAFARPERRTCQGKTAAPAGAPCEAPGSAACGQRHFSGYSFGAKRVPLRSLFVIAPQGALSSFEDGNCKDKRYSPAVSMISCEAKETPAYLASVRKRHSATRPRYPFPCAAKTRALLTSPVQGAAAAASLAPGFPRDKQQLR